MDIIERNVNALIRGPFKKIKDREAKAEIEDEIDQIFYNISTGLMAMDEIR